MIRNLTPVGIFLLCLSCSGMEHQAEEPTAAFPDSRSSDLRMPYAQPGESIRPQLTMAEVVIDCERHIRSWQVAMQKTGDRRGQESLAALEEAITIYVRREQPTIEEVAISGTDRLRGICSAALGFARNDAVLPILLNNLSDPNPDVVANAFFGLGVLASAETPVGPMLDAMVLHQEAAGIVRNASFSAARIAQVHRQLDLNGNPALATLLGRLLDRPEASVRAQGATGLGFLREAANAPQLLDLLAGDPMPSVRTAAAFALGEIGEATAAGSLIAALSDPDRMTAGAARASLVKLYGKDMGSDPVAWQGVFQN